MKKIVKYGWPKEVSLLKVTSSVDGTQQPSLWYSPQEISLRRPLLIALHTWSADYRQEGGQVVFGEWCIQQQWHFLHPNFRGANLAAEACGSDLALADILDAIQHVKVSTSAVDEDRIYVVGVSGGGHMALLLAAQFPHLWAGVSAWAAISDLEEWWNERSAVSSECPNHQSFQKYAGHIEYVLGGRPDGTLPGIMEECRKRSPVTHLSRLLATNTVNLDINAGITDGREGGSVPFWHSLQAFNAILPTQDKLGDDWMRKFYETQDAGSARIEKDFMYQGRSIHYRYIHGWTRLTIFEGGHEILHMAALNWLAHQRRGQPGIWKIPTESIYCMDVDKNLAEAGK